MNTKIVYCLASSEKDYYYEQLFISVHSLRKHNPEAYVEVVCDDKTYATLIGSRARIFELVTNVISITLPESIGQWERSRYLKTNLRKLVHGDYLFIDTDTIICGPLDSVDCYTFEVGAVKDEWKDTTIQANSKDCVDNTANSRAQRFGLNVVGYHYFNSGVMFVKDSPAAYSLYEKWTSLYDKYHTELKTDQFSLMLANHEAGDVITEMNRNLNCMVVIDKCIKHIQEAKIIHYYSRKIDFIISSPWLLDPIRDTGSMPCTIQSIIDNPGDFFKQRSQIIWGKDVWFMWTNLHTAYIEAPMMSQKIGKVLTCYVLLKRFIKRYFSH